MHEGKPIIHIAAHGVVSSKGKIIDVGNHCVVFPVKKGAPLEVATHNLLVYQTTRDQDPEKMLKNLEELPTTVSVSHKHNEDEYGKPKPRQLTIDDFSDTQARKRARIELDELEKEAFDSQKSWELLEHKLGPIYDLVKSGLLLKLPTTYHHKLLMTQVTRDDKTATTLKVFFDLEKIKTQVQSMLEQSPDREGYDKDKKVWLIKQEINKDHVLYMSPSEEEKKALKPEERLEKEFLNLSDVLSCLTKMHLVVKDTVNLLKSHDSKQVHIIDDDLLKIEDVYSTFKELPPSDTVIQEQIWCDITIPADSNILLGACRILCADF